MIRTVLAVVLAVAIIGAAVPAIEQGQIDRTETTIRGDLSALDTAITSLTTTEDATQTPSLAAQRAVTVTLPSDGIGAAPIETVVIDADGCTYRIVDGPTDRIPFATAERVVVAPNRSTETLTLNETGRHQLIARLRQYNGSRIIEIERHDRQSR